MLRLYPGGNGEAGAAIIISVSSAATNSQCSSALARFSDGMCSMRTSENRCAALIRMVQQNGQKQVLRCIEVHADILEIEADRACPDRQKGNQLFPLPVEDGSLANREPTSYLPPGYEVPLLFGGIRLHAAEKRTFPLRSSRSNPLPTSNIFAVIITANWLRAISSTR